MRSRLPVVLALLAALAAPNLPAATINYLASPVAGNVWRYDYTVSNDGAVISTIRLFDIYFDPSLYGALQIQSDAALAASWDQLLLAPGVGVGAAFDALATGPGIGVGGSVSGFAVSFTWLGAGAPGPQEFEIYDADTFQLVGSGRTSSVPAPAAAWLLATGVSVLATESARGRRRQRLTGPGPGS